MKHRLMLWIALGLLIILLMGCSLVGSKADVIQCTGVQSITSAVDGVTDWQGGNDFYVGSLYVSNVESDCPELVGVLKLTELTADRSGSGYNFVNWGIWHFETVYDGGGTIEGTFHGVLKNSVFNAELTSHNAAGSLRGLQASIKFTGTAGARDYKFEATIQNSPEE